MEASQGSPTASVADAMSRGTLSCQSDTTLRTIAAMMAEHGVHSVVVTDLDGVSEHAWGIVTDIDVVAAAGEDVDERTAGEVAATELLTIAPSDTLEHAAQLMTEHEVTHIVVVDSEGGKPLGVLSTLDVAGILARS
jgi:CBS domain-containing protein